jgi:xanthine dehydrogenase iron-sulfur-binding subunit
MIREITFLINGKEKTMMVDARKALAEVLREQLGLISIKQGCGVGECGACSVLVDDVLIDSCLYLAVWADGKKVRTLEGEQKTDKLTEVQEAYVENGAVQCGFCTPGFIMASTSFIEKNKGKNVTRHDIRKEHAGNLCRCTGYKKIIDAVETSMINDN